jgi:hypothetical protein
LGDYERLIEVIQWTSKLEKDIEDAVYLPDDKMQISKEFELFKREFLYSMLHLEKLQYPVTFYHLLQLLKRPIREWNLFSVRALEEEGISGELVILDEEIGLSEDADELLREAVSSREASTKVIRDVLVYCRRKMEEGQNMQDIYNAFRLFLISHPICNDELIELYCINHQFDPYLASALEICYEDIPDSSQFKCQACGWTLVEKNKGLYSCIKKECRRKYNASRLAHYQIADTETKRIKEAIQFSTVIPGLRELELKMRLEKRGAEVELYPNLEREGDLLVSKEQGASILKFSIDVKNYSSPKRLANQLIKDHTEGLLKSPVIAVPDEKTNRRYLQYVNGVLHEKKITTCKVYSFREIETMFSMKGSLQIEVRSFIQEKGEPFNVN